VAKLVVLWPVGASIRVGQGEASRLAALGVTSLTLLRDETTVGALLEGWAFDPVRSAAAAAATLSADAAEGSLVPTLEIGMTNATLHGGSDQPISTRPGSEPAVRSDAGR
jgi:hypothetical protein